MLNADELAEMLVIIIKEAVKTSRMKLFSKSQKEYYAIDSVESNGNIVRIVASDYATSRKDEWEFKFMTSGGVLIGSRTEPGTIARTVGDNRPVSGAAAAREAGLEDKETEAEVIDEAKPKGLEERPQRNVRLDKVEPTTKSHDKTPKCDANNSPLKTSKGRNAVRRRGKKNKAHPDQFKEGVEVSEFIGFIGEALQSDRRQIAELAKHADPLVESKNVKVAIEAGAPAEKLAEIDEIIHNVWSERLIEKYVGIANSRDGELAMFDIAAKLLNELKEWGAQVCWIERIVKPDHVVYKVCGDSTPSEAFMESKQDSNRDVILSGNRANIIAKTFGD